MINKAVMGEYTVMDIVAIYEKLKILWHFDFFVNTGPYGAGNFKTLLLLPFPSHLNETLGRHLLPLWNTFYYFSWQSPKFKKNVAL